MVIDEPNAVVIVTKTLAPSHTAIRSKRRAGDSFGIECRQEFATAGAGMIGSTIYGGGPFDYSVTDVSKLAGLHQELYV